MHYSEFTLHDRLLQLHKRFNARFMLAIDAQRQPQSASFRSAIPQSISSSSSTSIICEPSTSSASIASQAKSTKPRCSASPRRTSNCRSSKSIYGSRSFLPQRRQLSTTMSYSRRLLGTLNGAVQRLRRYQRTSIGVAVVLLLLSALWAVMVSRGWLAWISDPIVDTIGACLLLLLSAVIATTVRGVIMSSRSVFERDGETLRLEREMRMSCASLRFRSEPN